MKTCRKCSEEKPLTDFSKDKKSKDGLDYRCKACNATRIKAARKANPEKTRADALKYYYSNTTKEIARREEWRRLNSERDKAYRQSYCKSNSEKVKSDLKRW